MTKPRTRSVARMEAAAAAEARNPDAAEGSREPDAGEASRGPDAAEGSRGPDATEGSGEPAAAEGPGEPAAGEGPGEQDAAEGPGEPVPDAAQLAVEPYVEDMDQYLRALEADPTRRPIINYDQEIQGGTMNMTMRAILVDWMVEVAYEFKLLEETLHRAVLYVDRFLSTNAFNRNNLQLLGTTALFVASKYEEIRSPRARNFSAITDNTYSTQQVVEMEVEILRVLNFDMGTPTVITFLRRFLTPCRGGNESSNKRLELMCDYLAELSLFDDYSIRFLPSIVAAACRFVAKFTINSKTRPWVRRQNLSVQRNTGYKISDIEDCIRAIHDLQWDRNVRLLNLRVVRNKYQVPEFGSVSTITSPINIKASFLEDLKYVNG